MFFNCAFKLEAMATLGERVAEAINESKVRVQKVAEACGVTVQAVYAWRRGEVKDLRNDNLFALADVTEFEARWIATEKGPKRPEKSHKEKALLDMYRACDDRGQATVLRAAEFESRYIGEDDQQPRRSA